MQRREEQVRNIVEQQQVEGICCFSLHGHDGVLRLVGGLGNSPVVLSRDFLSPDHDDESKSRVSAPPQTAHSRELVDHRV